MDFDTGQGLSLFDLCLPGEFLESYFVLITYI